MTASDSGRTLLWSMLIVHLLREISFSVEQFGACWLPRRVRMAAFGDDTLGYFTERPDPAVRYHSWS